jgi:hypothetical protein
MPRQIVDDLDREGERAGAVGEDVQYAGADCRMPGRELGLREAYVEL